MLLAFILACDGVGASGGSPDDDGSALPSDTARDTATDTGMDEAPPYCRTLDPAWRGRYVHPLDDALAELIVQHGLLGDPALSLTATGACVRRETPSPDAPLARLGRALFFSMDLSGDQNVACASCHHPLLGGGDALSVSIGPTNRPRAMGADRVRGITDPSEIRLARNAQTTFNVAF